MDTDRLERWTRMFTERGALSRRGLSGLAAGAAAALALAVDTGAKKKKKKKKPTCPTPATPTTPTCQVACPAGANFCLDTPAWFCGLDCVCYTGTSRTICAQKNVLTCEECTSDAECDSVTGPGSVCLEATPGCECGAAERVCVLPCANPIPIQCS